MSRRKPGVISFAIVVTVVVILLTLSVFPLFMVGNVPSKSRPKSSEPAPPLIASFPVILYNNQSVSTPNPYDQMVIVNSSQFSVYEAGNLANVVWLTSGRIVIPSWIESGVSGGSTDTVYWLKIPFEISAHSSALIFIGFANLSANLFSATGNEGVFPSYSNIYGQYDNGAVVFPAFWDFKGMNQPSNLLNMSSNRATVYYYNGVVMYAPNNYQHSGFITSQTYPSNYVWMVKVTSMDIVHGDPGAYPLSISNTNAFSTTQFNKEQVPGGLPQSVVSNNLGSRYFVSNGNQGKLVNWGPKVENSSIYALGWYNNKVTGYTFDMQNAGNFSCNNISEHSRVYFSSFIETDYTSSALVVENWIAGMYGLPNGVMPEYSVSQSQLSG